MNDNLSPATSSFPSNNIIISSFGSSSGLSLYQGEFLDCLTVLTGNDHQLDSTVRLLTYLSGRETEETAGFIHTPCPEKSCGMRARRVTRAGPNRTQPSRPLVTVGSALMGIFRGTGIWGGHPPRSPCPEKSCGMRARRVTGAR